MTEQEECVSKTMSQQHEKQPKKEEEEVANDGEADNFSEDSFTNDTLTPSPVDLQQIDTTASEVKPAAASDDAPRRSHDPHHHEHTSGLCGSDAAGNSKVTKKESEALVNRMAEALRKARLDGLPESVNKKPPLSAALAYLAQANIRKLTLHVGSAARMPPQCSAPGGGIAYPPHTKFIFDYRVRDPDNPEVFFDDTKKYGKKMELYCGKDFQIEFWEYCLQTMCIGEVASFAAPPRCLVAYPAVMKKLRDFMLDKTTAAGTARHSCAFMSLHEGAGSLGYPDLDDLVTSPRILEFIFDLHSVVLPNEARKDTWIMTAEEKAETVPKLRQEGNELYGAGRWFEAAAKYEEGLNLLEQLVLAEKPGEPDFVRLDLLRVPFFINLAQCQFKLKDYYGAIRSTTEALNREPNNAKALFRRGMAHSATADVQLAEADFKRVRELAPETMGAVVARELTHLEEISRICREQERRLLAGKVFGKA